MSMNDDKFDEEMLSEQDSAEKQPITEQTVMKVAGRNPAWKVSNQNLT